jgi:exosortase/archaeosortase family protein
MDGSDDPLGIVAVVAVLGAVLLMRRELRPVPHAGWWSAALAGTVLATLMLNALPPLLAAAVAVLSLAAGLRAFLPAGRAAGPLAGLLVLSLPLLSSLQFYAGFPLRVLTAELSVAALQGMGIAATRIGSTMQVHGQLIVVDAPCSGVQMVWMAYFCACVMGWALSLPDRHFLRRLPLVGAGVLMGNVLRNLILVMGESRGPLSQAVHDGVGLAVLAAVCAGVCLLMRKAAR